MLLKLSEPQQLLEMNKRIAVVNTEDGGTITDLEIAPGTTVEEVLRQMNVQGARTLTVKAGEHPLNEADNLFAAVQDGQKVFLSTPISVA